MCSRDSATATASDESNSCLSRSSCASNPFACGATATDSSNWSVSLASSTVSSAITLRLEVFRSKLLAMASAAALPPLTLGPAKALISASIFAHQDLAFSLNAKSDLIKTHSSTKSSTFYTKTHLSQAFSKESHLCTGEFVLGFLGLGKH